MPAYAAMTEGAYLCLKYSSIIRKCLLTRWEDWQCQPSPFDKHRHGHAVCHPL